MQHASTRVGVLLSVAVGVALATLTPARAQEQTTAKPGQRGVEESRAAAPSPEMPKPRVKYYIQSNVSRLFLDVAGASKDDGGGVIQAVANPEQTWELIPAEHKGYYYIRSSVSGLHLDVLSGNAVEGQRVVQAKPHPDQVWSLIPAEKKGYFYIKTRLTRGQDLFLDIRGADKRAGADICVARKNGEQVWAFTPK
jgi:hypothetical protein